MITGKLIAAVTTWFQNRATLGWALTGVLVIVGGLVTFFCVVSPQLQSLMGGRRVLDVGLHTADGTQAILAAYGTTGRAVFLRYLAGDLLTPAVYGPLLALATSFAANRFGWSSGSARVATLLPLAAWLFDWGENATLAVLTRAFPRLTDMGWLVVALTVSKFLAFGASFLLSVAGLIRSLGGQT